MGKHTPGPWAVSNLIGVPDLGIVNVYGSAIARITRLDLANRQANAARIVACVNACEGLNDPSVVPELVKALEMVLATHIAHHNNPAHAFARAAIAKAKGDAA